jgi:ATP-binding cassette subfamily B protein
MTTTAGTAAVLFLGALHVQAETLTLGELLMVMAYLAQLYGPMETVSKKIADLQGSLVSAERAYALLDESPDVQDRPGALHLVHAQGAVTFQSVSFSYPHNPPVLHEVSLEIPAGSRVGIEGTTGAGKTTLVSLLTRFYDPTAGQILLDGVDLRDYRLADLRNQFAIVLQDTVLFSTTVAENIAYARPGASDAEIVAAAHAANAHDFITRLPQGYETKVGERGMRLSGGERQRIALARAFLKDAPIVILDEPTSSVDLRTERLIIEALERLMRGRTTFIIAHRLSTLDDCNVRLRVEDGRLVDRERSRSLALA